MCKNGTFWTKHAELEDRAAWGSGFDYSGARVFRAGAVHPQGATKHPGAI